MTLTAIMAAAPVERIKLEPIGNSAPASIGPIPAPRSLHTVQAAKASTRAGPGFCMATIGDTIGITSERKITTITAPAAKAAFSGSACALSTERLVVKNPSKAKPCTKDQRCKGLGHLNFLGDFG